MKMHLPMALLLSATVGLGTIGCGSAVKHTDTLAEGVIWLAEFRTEDGRTEGFTRMNEPKLVPGGNGSWNVDAYGRLTRDFLFVTRPQQKDLGQEVIPTGRLIRIQFGDGGIKQVDEGRPKSPSDK